MPPDIKTAAELASLRVLRPFARFALKARIGIGEFVWLLKQAYVLEVVAQEKGKGRTRPNITRIANTTGLTPQDVRAVLAEVKGESRSIQRGAVRAEKVLHAWWTVKGFQDRVTRKPRRLKYLGPHPSFQSLVEGHSGQRHPASILEELVSSQAVKQLDDGTLEPLRKTCVNVDWDERALYTLGKRIERCFEVYLHNLEDPYDRRFAHSISGTMDADSARVVIPDLTSHAVTFMEGARETITHPKHAPRSAPVRSKSVEFGIDIEFWQMPTERSGPSPSSQPRGKRRKSASTRAESK